ncbi:MAG: TetR/AcrR family transcriptional regulator [Acidimicrobiia bacterium]
MPSSSEVTRARLIRAAEHLFARHGFDVPVQTIHDVAGQRNSSALNYHFGGREGLVQAVFESHAMSDAEVREIMRGLLADEHDPRAVVDAVVERQCVLLATPEGRDWLRIMSHAQLRAPVRQKMLDTLDGVQPPLSPSLQALTAVLHAHAPGLDPALAEERGLRVFTFLMFTVADRARVIDEDRGSLFDEGLFADNLSDMVLGALLAPRRAVVAPARRRPG